MFSLGSRAAFPPWASELLGLPVLRGEYFYLSLVGQGGLIFFRAEIFNFECSVQKFSYFGVLCKNIGQVLLHATRPSQFTVWIWPMSLEYFLKPWKMRQNNEFHADLASFLFNCARKNAFLVGLCRNTTFFGVCAEILLSRDIEPPKSCAGPFLGVVQKY